MKLIISFFVPALLASLLASACGAPTHFRIAAPESMFKENRMRKLALLGEGA